MNYSFIQYNASMNLPDGIYNARYNKEPSIIRIKEGTPCYVQFIEKNGIFNAKGILNSNVELLLPAQTLSL